MKIKKILLLCSLCFLLFNSASAQTGGTPFYFSGVNADGSPTTNIFTVQVWPPDVNGFTVYGTNIIFSGVIYTNTPSATGFWTNRLYPNTYVVRIPDFGRFFFVKILDTPLYLPLAMYATNIAAVNNPLGFYGIVTNWLGFAPATNSKAGVISAFQAVPATNTFAALTASLGYTPLTNSFAALTNAIAYTPLTNSFVAITNALSYQPATNSYTGITIALGYTPLTNSYAALTNAINFQPATNSYVGIVSAAGYQPATNSFNSITNLLIASGGVPAMLGYIPATNTSMGLIATLGYLPANITNVPGLFTAGPGLTVITNGNTYYVSTNLPTEVFPTLAAPNGSILVSTNGSLYVRTNSVWVLK